MVIFAYQDEFSWAGISTGNEVNPIKLKYSAKDSIDKIVNDIYDTYKYNQGGIDCLFLVGHGNAGVLYLGDGLGACKSVKFAKLRECFSHNSRGIEIHGCACASATSIPDTMIGVLLNGKGTENKTSGPGFDFLKSLAVSSGVKVTAPIDSISGWSASYSFKDVRTMTVDPFGKIELRQCK